MGFGSPSVTQSTQPNLSPIQQQYQNQALGWLGGQVGQPGPSYPGQLTAPLSPEQGQAIGQQGALGQFAAGPEATGFNTIGATAGGAYLNDPYTSGLLGASRNQFMQDVQQLRSPFQMAGQTGYSTPEQSTMNQAAAQFETGQAQLQENIYQQERQRQQDAANAGATLGMGAGQQGLAALTMPQQTQQTAMTNLYNDWLRQQQNPWMAAGMFPGLTGATGQTSTGQQGGSIFDTIGGLAGLAGPVALLKMAGMF